jgi:hypothetical protein
VRFKPGDVVLVRHIPDVEHVALPQLARVVRLYPESSYGPASFMIDIEGYTVRPRDVVKMNCKVAIELWGGGDAVE